MAKKPPTVRVATVRIVREITADDAFVRVAATYADGEKCDLVDALGLLEMAKVILIAETDG